MCVFFVCVCGNGIKKNIIPNNNYYKKINNNKFSRRKPEKEN